MLQGTVSLLLKDTIDSLQNTIDSYCMAQQIHIFNRQFYVATEISGIYCKAQYPKPTCSTTHGRYKTCPSQCTGKGSARGYETRSARTRVTTKWITTPIQKFPGKREGKEKKQNKMEGKRKIQKKKNPKSLSIQHFPRRFSRNIFRMQTQGTRERVEVLRPFSNLPKSEISSRRLSMECHQKKRREHDTFLVTSDYLTKNNEKNKTKKPYSNGSIPQSLYGFLSVG